MVVTYKQTANLATNFYDNQCRWDRQSASHYEVWFVTLNHRESQRGFWFRYTLDSPSATAGAEPEAGLWGAAFSRVRPHDNFGIRSVYPMSEVAVEGEPGHHVRIGESLLSANRATGAIRSADHSVEWDLTFEPCSSTYHHASPMLVRLARPTSFICSPNLDTRFTGEIVVDGRRFAVKEEPGCQSHLWGRKHVDDWVWAHSNAFEKHPGTVFEGLAARPRHAGRAMPPVQSLYLKHRGQEHRFVRLRFAEQWQRRLGIGYWSFSAFNPNLYIEGTAHCRLRDMLQAEYLDPDGESLFCVNTEVANLKIRLFRRVHGVRWRHIETINAHASAHLEHASRSRDQAVRFAFDR